jgi:hypothetical protein
VNPDFTDMLSALSAEGAEFLVVGAHALAVHGHPRATGDLDLWIRPTSGNAARVYRALARFGAPLDALTEGDLVTPGVVFQFGRAPCRIDLLTAVSGLDWERAWASHVVVEVDGFALPVLGREDLIANKRAAGRPKDLADLHALETGEE